jgi:ABC-2 type transport system ATP-binding protein
MTLPAIAVRGLTKTYRGQAAVDGLDFEVSTGTITGFLGPNGAGKTTTIRALTGLIRPDSGEALVGGTPYRRLVDPIRQVGVFIDGAGFSPARTARAHLEILATQSGVALDRVDYLLALVDLANVADRRTGGFSLGMKQRLGLATALLGDPQLLILDEPSNGLDPAGIRWMRSFLKEYAASGRTVFVSSHVLSEMTNLVDDVVVIKDGRLLTQTRADSLTGDRHVLVRTPDGDCLARALLAAGAAVERAGDGALRVGGMPMERVGDTARDTGVAVHELSAMNHTLEDAFLELTQTEVTYV